jgi:hypothetical protein
MLDELWRLIEGRRVIPAAPTGFSPKLPSEDDFDLIEDDGDADLEGIAGVGCILTYEDSRGALSIRRVTCRKLSHHKDARYVQAWCHERQSLRTFRLDRITETACAVTGELFTPGSLFFDHFVGTEDGGAAVGFGLSVRLAADLRAALNVLAFLAKADGRIVPEERDVMQLFCQAFALRYANGDFDFDGVCQHAQRLAPDAEIFFVSLQRLTQRGAADGISKLVRRYAGDLIEADGEQHPKEFYFGMKVQEALSG